MRHQQLVNVRKNQSQIVAPLNTNQKFVDHVQCQKNILQISHHPQVCMIGFFSCFFIV